MSDVVKQLKEKENLLLGITNQLIGWDHSVDHALVILSENDEKFAQMQELDQQIPETELKAFNEKYNQHWQKLINLQQELMQAVQKGQTETQGQLSQIDKKNKVVSNYMQVKNKSIFIEKDY